MGTKLQVIIPDFNIDRGLGVHDVLEIPKEVVTETTTRSNEVFKLMDSDSLGETLQKWGKNISTFLAHGEHLFNPESNNDKESDIVIQREKFCIIFSKAIQRIMPSQDVSNPNVGRYIESLTAKLNTYDLYQDPKEFYHTLRSAKLFLSNTSNPYISNYHPLVSNNGETKVDSFSHTLGLMYEIIGDEDFCKGKLAKECRVEAQLLMSIQQGFLAQMSIIGDNGSLSSEFQGRLHTFGILISKHPNTNLRVTIKKPFLAAGYNFSASEHAQEVVNKVGLVAMKMTIKNILSRISSIKSSNLHLLDSDIRKLHSNLHLFISDVSKIPSLQSFKRIIEGVKGEDFLHRLLQNTQNISNTHLYPQKERVVIEEYFHPEDTVTKVKKNIGGLFRKIGGLLPTARNRSNTNFPIPAE